MPEDEYLILIGLALYMMNGCEYLAMEVANWLDPSLDFAHLAGDTGGKICQALTNAIAGAGSMVPADVVDIPAEYAQLVQERNDVVHARPCTDDQGRARLNRWAPTKSSRSGAIITEEILRELQAKTSQVHGRLFHLREHLRETRLEDSPLGYGK